MLGGVVDIAQGLHDAGIADHVVRLVHKDGQLLGSHRFDGVDIAAAPSLYRRFRERSEVWKYGLRPDEVDRFLDGYGWRLLDQLGPDQARDRYVRPTGRALPTSSLEWSALARKI